MKTPNPSHKYSGKLTSIQLAEGIRCCIENSGYLLTTASHLIDTNFYGPASSLCFTALEEIGKAYVLHTMAQYPRSECLTAPGTHNLLQ
ncbi:AbiV family abortive infection protein [Chloroflexota bacterium]